MAETERRCLALGTREHSIAALSSDCRAGEWKEVRCVCFPFPLGSPDRLGYQCRLHEDRLLSLISVGRRSSPFKALKLEFIYVHVCRL